MNVHFDPSCSKHCVHSTNVCLLYRQHALHQARQGALPRPVTLSACLAVQATVPACLSVPVPACLYGPSPAQLPVLLPVLSLPPRPPHCTTSSVCSSSAGWYPGKTQKTFALSAHHQLADIQVKLRSNCSCSKFFFFFVFDIGFFTKIMLFWVFFVKFISYDLKECTIILIFVLNRHGMAKKDLAGISWLVNRFHGPAAAAASYPAQSGDLNQRYLTKLNNLWIIS